MTETLLYTLPKVSLLRLSVKDMTYNVQKIDQVWVIYGPKGPVSVKYFGLGPSKSIFLCLFLLISIWLPSLYLDILDSLILIDDWHSPYFLSIYCYFFSFFQFSRLIRSPGKTKNEVGGSSFMFGSIFVQNRQKIWAAFTFTSKLK